jgi:hypothetical protein
MAHEEDRTELFSLSEIDQHLAELGYVDEHTRHFVIDSLQLVITERQENLGLKLPEHITRFASLHEFIQHDDRSDEQIEEWYEIWESSALEVLESSSYRDLTDAENYAQYAAAFAHVLMAAEISAPIRHDILEAAGINNQDLMLEIKQALLTVYWKNNGAARAQFIAENITELDDLKLVLDPDQSESNTMTYNVWEHLIHTKMKILQKLLGEEGYVLQEIDVEYELADSEETELELESEELPIARSLKVVQ